MDDSWRPVGRGDRSRRRSRSRRDGQRPDESGYEQDYEPQDYEPQRHEQGQYRQDPYRQDEYGRGQSGRYSQDQRVPDPYAQGGRYRPDPYNQDQYSQDQHSQGQHSRDQYYGQGQHSRDQYGRDQYPQERYVQEQYPQEQYPQEQYPRGQYGPEQYGREEYAPDPYARDPYGQEQYRPTASRQGSYGPDRYGSERRGPDPYGPGTDYREQEHNGYSAGYSGYSRDGRYESERLGSQPAAVPLSQQSPEAPVASVAEDELTAPVSRGSAQSRPYGRLQIFTLLDDKVTDFDRLAEQTAEEVRIGEPDTLVYVIHLVPNAPMQRIFYEIYRDRAAFDSHENKSYTKRFVSERRAYVLATNVIELRLKYAKVAPLPIDSRQLDAGRAARAQLPPGPASVTQRHEATTARHAASAPRQAGSSGQWAQPPADPRYGRV